MPAPVRHRLAGTPDPGTGAGRIRYGLAKPQWAPDREPDRSAPDDGSGSAGRHASARSPIQPRFLYRLSTILLAPVPHGECHPTTRDMWRVRARLRLFRVYPRRILSPSQRELSFRQTLLRPGREARLHRLSGKGPPYDGKDCLLDAADRKCYRI